MASVCIGYIHNGSMVTLMVESMIDMIAHEAARGTELWRLSVGGPYIADNRNQLTDRYLTRTPAEYLLCLDTDMVFGPDLLEQLLAAACPRTRPVVAGIYVNRIEAVTAGEWYPTWFNENGDGTLHPVRNIELGEVRQVDMAATGCMLIHRHVLEKVGHLNRDDPWRWFGHDIVNGERLGEDLTFCRRVRAAGIPIHGYGYPLEHVKTSRVGVDALPWHNGSQQAA